jgi:hypothetical protein
MPPTDSSDEDDGFDPLFSESGPAAGWDPLGMPVEGDGEDEEEMLGGGLIEELRRETLAKKRLDMDEGEGEMVAGADAKGKRSKRKRKEGAPTESAREKKRSEKVSALTCVFGSCLCSVELFVDFADGFCGLMRAGEECASRFNPRRVTEVAAGYECQQHIINEFSLLGFILCSYI